MSILTTNYYLLTTDTWHLVINDWKKSSKKK